MHFFRRRFLLVGTAVGVDTWVFFEGHAREENRWTAANKLAALASLQENEEVMS